MSTEDFHDLVDDDLWKRIDLIRRIGNRAAHNGRKVVKDEAVLCLQNLYTFFDYVMYCYADNYSETFFDIKLLENQNANAVAESIDKSMETGIGFEIAFCRIA